MARENGSFPTWKLGTLGSIGMYVAACSRNPVLRDAIFPLTGTVTIVYLMLRRATPFLIMERKTPPLSMNDVSTTFMGIYYLGYMPSFWVRCRLTRAFTRMTPRMTRTTQILIHTVTHTCIRNAGASPSSGPSRALGRALTAPTLWFAPLALATDLPPRLLLGGLL